MLGGSFMEKLHIDLGKKSYDIYIKKGILDGIGEYISQVYKNKNIIVVTDVNVDRLYGEKIIKNLKAFGYSPKKVVFKNGEENKNFETLITVQDEIILSGIKRGDLLITFGGGVVGDLGGFAASILYRGIDYIQVPTTLLSQVDSSVGGKVAINTNTGKNLVGSFYQPKMVIIDPNLLETLEEREIKSGIGEIIKYGLIYDQDFYKTLLVEDIFDNIEEVIKRCCEIKAKIVEADEFDEGLRMILNFGHTLGHGIEKYYNYQKYTHGEAIAIGMYKMVKIGERLGVTPKGEATKIRKILEKYKLPLDDEVKIIDLLEVIKSDKKNISGKLNIVILKTIGEAEIMAVKDSELTILV